MTRPKVYFYGNTHNINEGINILFKRISEELGKDKTEKIGVKIHFGEKDNDTHISPDHLKNIKDFFPKATFIETNVLYKGERTRRTSHIELARRHGFGFLPIDILDGEVGEERLEIAINTKNTKKALVAEGIKRYDNMIILSHFKGHIAAGIGGTLKNIGMGLSSRAGKLDMHASVGPYVDQPRCIACNKCIEHCDFDAIEMDEKANILPDKCVGCAMCIAVCPTGAVSIPWGKNSSEVLMEKIADYALASIKDKNVWYINFLTNITPECDCMGKRQKPIMQDLGLLYSKDPVAIDQASIDLIKKAKGTDPFKEINNINSNHILDYGQSIGLGSKGYELIKI